MGLFRNKDEGNDKFRPELARISAMPLHTLAAEAMLNGFGPGTKGADGATGMGTIAGAFNPAMINVGIDQDSQATRRSRLGAASDPAFDQSLFLAASVLRAARLGHDSLAALLSGFSG